ncbi:MAG: hypothetical protein JKY56_00885 [Kofleriaceae bacterium]|nr:hypothetical protein [Kofleriaceae bacterium]
MTIRFTVFPPWAMHILLLVALVWISPATASPGKATPDKASDNNSCKQCHNAQWRQWRSSLHSSAGKNAVFRYEYNAHPGKWCLTCHAPRTLAQNAIALRKRPAMRQGVDCVTCHLRSGEFVSRTKAGNSPHDTRIDPEFGSPAMCAGCHQFNFPKLDTKGNLVHYTSQPMQNTYAEFRKSPAAARGLECINCHMPTGREHSFPGAYDADMVNSALKVTMCQDKNELQLRIANRLQAHNLPSGGVNRSIVIEVAEKSSKRKPKRYRLERLFDGPIGKRVKTKDTTLVPGQWHNWRIPYSLLSTATPKSIVVKARFFFGTDPNKNYPTTQRVIFKTETKFSDIPVCLP